MRRPLILFLLIIGTGARAQMPQEQRAPRCGSRDTPDMEAFMLRRVYRLLTDQYWAAERAKAGMASTASSAPRAALTDKVACKQLRQALEREVGKGAAELTDRYQLFFYTVGDYRAVYAQLKRDPASDVETHQRYLMRIYSKEQKPRLLMTVYM